MDTTVQSEWGGALSVKPAAGWNGSCVYKSSMINHLAVGISPAPLVKCDTLKMENVTNQSIANVF